MLLLALVLIMLGMLLMMLGLIMNRTDRTLLKDKHYYYELEDYNKIEPLEERKVKAGGVVLIGPIPIVFGNLRYALYALILTLLLVFIIILLTLGV